MKSEKKVMDYVDYIASFVVLILYYSYVGCNITTGGNEMKGMWNGSMHFVTTRLRHVLYLYYIYIM